MTIRTLVVREDEEGLYVRFKHFEEHLIIRPGTITDRDKIGLYEKGSKVKVRHWNKQMGYFMVEKPGGHSATCMWQGPRYDNQSFKWIYDDEDRIR